ncbi:MAG TPA: glycosyltransferase [Thermoplasmata archaeon]|nr:glycosyltransferase [Thermoplasmata archaeon]
MEVIFFTDSFPPMRDGVAAVTNGLARSIRRLGHSVHVFAPHPIVGAPTEELEVDGVALTRVRSLPVPLYPQYRWPLNPLALLRERRGVGDADVLHIHSPGGIGSAGFLTSRRYALPLVGTFHTNIAEMQGSFPSRFLVPTFFRIAAWYNLGTYWRCDVATAPSTAARDALLARARKPFRHPVEVVPNGIDVDRFRPGLRVPDWRARCGLPLDPLVTYLGRLTVDKGVHRFLDAVEASLARTDLVAIVGGSGPEEAAVRERIRASPRLAERVRYVGPVAEEEKASLLSQTDLFVLPSTSDTSSVALMEAMASGAMVLAPAAGGAAEVVEDGVTGVRVPVLEPGALARAVTEQIDRPEERRRIARQGADGVRRTSSLDTMARRFISLYEMAITSRSSRDRRSAARD